MLKHKKIGIIAARLGGIDGVSLEVDKWLIALKKMGWEIHLCAGEIKSSPFGYSQITGQRYHELIKAKIIPELTIASVLLNKKIKQKAVKIEAELTKWLNEHKIRTIVVENINSLPVNISAALAIRNILEKNSQISGWFHHHDFYWERERYSKIDRRLKIYLRKYFPPQLENAFHITINSIAQKELFKRHKIRSVVIPNIFDQFNIKKDKYNENFRRDIEIRKDDLLFLAPVRIVARKNIEAAIKLVKILNNPKIKLVIAGCPDFVTGSYLKKLKSLAQSLGDQVKFVCSRIGPRRRKINKRRIYTVFDAMVQADFVIYPSLYEGWGNALGEAMISRVPILVNRYQVFKQDIEKLGFEVVKINNGKLSRKAVNQLIEILGNKNLREKIVEKNNFLIKKHFGLKALEQKLNYLLQ